MLLWAKKAATYNQIKANMDKTGKNAITLSAVLDEVPDKLTVYAWDMTTRTPIFDAVEIAAESPSEDLSNVTYEGVANKEDKITITVLAPDKTLDNLMEEGSTVRPLCYREVVADETGKYSALRPGGQIPTCQSSVWLLRLWFWHLLSYDAAVCRP